MEKLVVVLLLIYGAASLMHYTHNAEFLREYPNMPGWLPRSRVYAAWIAVTAIGMCGYVLWRLGYKIVGLAVIGAYAGLGFDGLAHYAIAPFRDHSATMHATIWLEVLTAALLLATVVGCMTKLALARTRGRGR
ncbi:MAG: hypothetical protein ACREUN_09720 [Burkholderiales bacterium]